MKKEKLYTKYKFNRDELAMLCLFCKVKPDELVDKLDSMSYDERKALYHIIPFLSAITKCKKLNFQ